MRRLFVIWVFCIGLHFVLGDLAQIFAQEGSTEEFTLEEITVTAQKREENQQKVPIAMEVISGDEIKELGKNDIDEILSNISNVLINTSSDGLRVSIRGMSNDAAPHMDMQTSKPTVAVNKDGIYTNRNTGNANLFDIERVEVLYGPQSTLYASASPGGVVNVVTTDPKLDTFEGSGSLEYGNYSQLKMEGAMNAPISDATAIRGSFSSSTHEGYLSNGGDDLDSKAARLKFLYQPNDKLSIVTTGEINKNIGQGYSLSKVFVNQDDATFKDGTPLNDPWTSASTTASAATKMIEKRISAHISYDLGYAGALSVIPAYTRATNFRTGTGVMGGGPPGTEVLANSTLSGKAIEKGLEVRMASSEDFPFKWIVGFNVYSNREAQHSWYYEVADADPDVMDGNSINRNETKTKAIYANLTYPVTDRVRLTGGARKTSDVTNTGGERWNSTLNPDNPEILSPNQSNSMKYNKPDYKVGIEFDVAGNSMFYADWSTSYRINGMGPGKVLPPEKLKAYTAGAKNRFFQNKLQLNVSAYYYDYKNYFMVGDPVRTLADDNDNGIWDPGEDQYIDDLGALTTGDATINGFDLQTSTVITANDKLDFSVSYVNKKFAASVFDFYPQTNSLGLEDVSYEGMKMTNAPPWTVDITYSHNFHLRNGGVLTPRLSYKFQSGYLLTWQAFKINTVREGEEEGLYTYYFTRTERGRERFQEAYRLGDISLTYVNPDGKWTLNCYVNNLENYAVKRSLQGPNGDELRLGPPRTYGGVLTIRF